MNMKWKNQGHVRAALQQHARDLLEAAQGDNPELLLKELTDITVIGELIGLPQELLDLRRAKFQSTLNLPPLG